MRTSRMYAATFASCITLTLVYACKVTSAGKSAKPGEYEAVAYDLGPGAKACGNVVTLGDVSGNASAPQPVIFQVAVCGFIEASDPSTEWKALGATLISEKVQVVRNGAQDATAVFTLFLDAQGKLAAVGDDGVPLALGKALAHEDGAPVSLSDGVQIELIGDGKTFDVAKSQEWKNAVERFVRVHVP